MLEELKGIDIYLLDQMLKGRIGQKRKILDAGCGMGRNINYFLKNDFNVWGIDPNEECIHYLKDAYPKLSSRFLLTTIEDFECHEKFDFIICNAVLHFARNHSHFKAMFEKLFSLLAKNGVLFIRMTSNMGLPYEPVAMEEGLFHLRDDSQRFLLTRKILQELIHTHKLALIEPVKSVLVNDLRSMTTLVLARQEVGFQSKL